MLALLALCHPGWLRQARFRGSEGKSNGLSGFHAGPEAELTEGLRTPEATLPYWIPGTSGMNVSILERVASVVLNESSGGAAAESRYADLRKYCVVCFGEREPYVTEFQTILQTEHGIDVRYASWPDRERFSDWYWAEYNVWMLNAAIPSGWQDALATAAIRAKEKYLAWRLEFLHSKAYEDGCGRARKELASGKFGLQTWGMPVLNHYLFADAAAKRLPLEVHISGCVASIDDVRRWAGYNRVMLDALERQFGSDWYVPILSESEANVPRALKSRSGHSHPGLVRALEEYNAAIGVSPDPQ